MSAAESATVSLIVSVAYVAATGTSALWALPLAAAIAMGPERIQVYTLGVIEVARSRLCAREQPQPTVRRSMPQPVIRKS